MDMAPLIKSSWLLSSFLTAITVMEHLEMKKVSPVSAREEGVELGSAAKNANELLDIFINSMGIVYKVHFPKLRKSVERFSVYICRIAQAFLETKCITLGRSCSPLSWSMQLTFDIFRLHVHLLTNSRPTHRTCSHCIVPAAQSRRFVEP